MKKDIRTFIQVHDGLPNHPKIMGLSDAAFRLLITLWCHCGHYLTDGLLAEAMWKKGRTRARSELLHAGLVEVWDDGVIYMHDFLDHQPSAAERLRSRDNHSEASARGALIANHNRWHIARRLSDPDCKLCLSDQSLVSDTDQGSESHPDSGATRSTTRSKSQEEEEEKEEELRTLAATPSQRKLDPLFDAMVQVCVINPAELTRTERGRVNAALKQIRDVGATPELVAGKAAAYRKRYPDVSLTPTALASNWGSLAVAVTSDAPVNDWWNN